MKKLKLSILAFIAVSGFAYAGGKLVAPPEVPPIPIINVYGVDHT